jgi:hypothetical protein
MSAPKGWPSQQKDDRLQGQFATVESIRELQHGLSVLAHQFVFEVGTDAVEANSTTSEIVATAHLAKKGDVIQFTSGALSGKEVKVYEVETNSIILAETLESIPAAAVTFSILRHKYPLVNSAGSVATTSVQGPTKFVKDGIDVEVTEDTVTPANNLPLPVKITSTTGDINITAGDLNVQLSHAGANYDSTRIGDGTNLLGVSAAGEAKVLDATAHTKLDSLLTELQLKADLTETQPVSAASLPLPTGAATEVTLSALNTKVTACDTTGKATLAEQQSQTTHLASIAGEDFSTETTLAALNAKVTACNTGSVTVASSALPTGAATETTLSALNTKVTACNTGAVTITSALPVGTNQIGYVKQLMVQIDLIDGAGFIDASSTNIPGSASAPLQVVAVLASNAKWVQFIDTTGGLIGLYSGGIGTEVLQLVCGPGSDSLIPMAMSAGVRLSIKRLDSTTALSSGLFALNIYGD